MGDAFSMPTGAAKSDVQIRREFALRLRAARLSSGYKSAKDFAIELGMEEPETYRRWERGETEPGIAMLKKISEKTGHPLDWLISGAPDMLRGATQPRDGRAGPFTEPPPHAKRVRKRAS